MSLADWIEVAIIWGGETAKSLAQQAEVDIHKETWEQLR